jgi:predicted DNA-binding transcriptional regulator AlpA
MMQRKIDESDTDLELPVLLDAGDLAKLLKKTRAAVYAMHSRNPIPGEVRVGTRGLYFRLDEVLRWLEARSRA